MGTIHQRLRETLDSRLLREDEYSTEKQPTVFQVGEHLQGPDDDRSSNRSLGAPQRGPRAERAELPLIGSDSLDTNLVRVMLDFSAITGTVSTAIPANEAGFGVVDTLGPVISYPAKTQLASIAVGSTVLCLPRKGEWIAYKVC